MKLTPLSNANFMLNFMARRDSNSPKPALEKGVVIFSPLKLRGCLQYCSCDSVLEQLRLRQGRHNDVFKYKPRSEIGGSIRT